MQNAIVICTAHTAQRMQEKIRQYQQSGYELFGAVNVAYSLGNDTLFVATLMVSTCSKNS